MPRRLIQTETQNMMPTAPAAAAPAGREVADDEKGRNRHVQTSAAGGLSARSLLGGFSSGRERAECRIHRTGLEDLNVGIEVQAFLPENIAISEGDTITWRFVPEEAHTVTFLREEEQQDLIVAVPDGAVV